MAPASDSDSNENDRGTGGATNQEAQLKFLSKDPKKKDDRKDEDLLEDDLALKQRLEMYVERGIQDSDPGLQKVAIESLRQEIQNTTSSMISIPLKFLRPHYGKLKEQYEKMVDSDLKKLLADILSVLAWTTSAEEESESLKYRLLGSDGDIGSWGHEYVRNLTRIISQDYAERQADETLPHDLLELIHQIVDFLLKHNEEPEAVDLLIEVGRVDLLVEHVDEMNFKRTCMYLTSMAKYLPEGDDDFALEVASTIYLRNNEYAGALQVELSIATHGYKKVEPMYVGLDDDLMRKQLGFIIGRHGIQFLVTEDILTDDKERKELQRIVNNDKLSEGYLALACDMEVMEPKFPEDICKAHFNFESTDQRLGAIFVNAFVNAGFGQVNFVTVPSEASSDSCTNWFFEDLEYGKTSAVACLGMIFLWNVDYGLPQLEKYLKSTETPVLAGAFLALGIVNCGIRHECDIVTDILDACVNYDESLIRIGAIMGLGLSHAGVCNLETMKLIPVLKDPKTPLDVIAFTAISLGLIFLGSRDENISEAIIFALMHRSESEMKEPLTRFLTLGLGLLYLGKRESLTEATAEVLKTLNDNIRRHCDMTLLSFAYAGTGDVLKVQDFLGQCAQHLENSETYQVSAVLGIALVAMGEELGNEMAMRMLEHLLWYGAQNIRKAVPLALSLLSISNPKVTVMDTLSKLSRDSDTEVAMAAIISLGLIGAGTNNARIAGILERLCRYYVYRPNFICCVRIAQGLVYMGKGLLSLSPHHSEGVVLSPTGLAGLIIFLNACLDMNAFIFAQYEYVLYFLALAMKPRMLMTLDGDLKPLSVPVHVGQAIDVTGQAGQPKTITGFRTLSTPVILSAGERAELATKKYIPLSPMLEGFVILKENPNYNEED